MQRETHETEVIKQELNLDELENVNCGAVNTELWNAFKRITANASASDKTALYSGTAARVYRLIAP